MPGVYNNVSSITEMQVRPCGSTEEETVDSEEALHVHLPLTHVITRGKPSYAQPVCNTSIPNVTVNFNRHSKCLELFFFIATFIY